MREHVRWTRNASVRETESPSLSLGRKTARGAKLASSSLRENVRWNVYETDPLRSLERKQLTEPAEREGPEGAP